MTPRATYRLQLSTAFTFDDAARRAPYLAALGVSTLYCSPVLQAAPGSTHGYDVVDPTRVSAELGGELGLRRLAEAMRDRGIELLVDIVPNHMATAGRTNPWWWEVLLNGPHGRYGRYFDVDWKPTTSTVKGKILLGVLGDRYGREIDRGALTLQRDRDEIVVRYREHVFPVTPESVDGLDIEAASHDPDMLDSVLQRQNYRLAYWRSAQEELNYRRFFTIDSLIGLRVEDAEVFEDSHRLLLGLVHEGVISGLRVDHVDGLRDPGRYLERLHAAAPDSYVVVEKILGPGERLPKRFAVHGTTGYDFIAAVDGIFVNRDNEPSLTAFYHAFTGEAQPYAEVLRASQREVAANELAPDLERLTALLVEICDADRHHRDRTRRELRDAILELAVGLPIYRTYTREGIAPAEHDHAYLVAAVEEASRRSPDIDPDLLALVLEVLLGRRGGEEEEEFTARFQQFTPAVMAKGAEDTAFYRYNRLVSLNEVGGDPGLFGRTVEAFHEWCAWIAAEWPGTMLTLSTHDSKRTGDVRARLNLLSEIPAEWEAAVRRWSEHNDRYRSQGYPDRNLEYLAYQTLVGAWPIDAERLVEFLRKAAREAKVHTSWTNPTAAYEDAMARFVGSAMSDAEFTSDLESFLGANQLVVLGRIAALAQTTLLLTCPGVPDLYQGSEVWNLALVDPDNRRQVDFDAHEALLSEISELDAASVMYRADDGSPKLWLITRLLAERARNPELFAGQHHTPVCATGSKAQHCVAFARGPLFVLVPRLVIGLAGDWDGTLVDLPAGRWTNVLTGAEFQDAAGTGVQAVLGPFPVAVMRRTSE